MPSASPSSSDTSDLHPAGVADEITVDALTAQLANVLLQPASPAYLELAPSILLAIRPPGEADATDLRPYISEYYDCGEAEKESSERNLRPHMYSLAAKAFYFLRRTRQDQALLFHSAASAALSGQSEQRRLATRALLSLSSSSVEASSKHSRIARQIQAADYIIDAFGSVGSGGEFTFSLPRFGRYTELQFSDRGRIVGCKTLLYGLDLDTGRIGFDLEGINNGVQNRERSFDAARWLVAGASRNERDHLKLPETGSGRNVSIDTFDERRFGILKQAFKAFGFPKKAGRSPVLTSFNLAFVNLRAFLIVAAICSFLAAILHISTLQFSPSSSSNASTACVISTPDALYTIASLLGLLQNAGTSAANLAKLEEAFTSKTAYVDGEKCTIVLDTEKANENKDGVAKVLYKLLWEWLGEYVNQKLEKETFDGS